MKFFTALLLFISIPVFALTTGEMAPNFSLPGLKKEVSLNDFKGKIVVLEWLNHGCPFVRKHYDSGNMQKLQKNFTDKGVIWLSIISSAPGKQGHVEQNQALGEKKKYSSHASDILLDPSGKIGKLYAAKTTPHMYIIDNQGKLVYQGAIDDKADADQNSIPSAKNYITSALDELMNGKAITAHTTRSYGCSIKYE